MPLPISKGEFNRLGDRLIAGENPSEVDLESLGIVLAAYQEVLELVKAHLRELGFAPSDRVKTTKTMMDKLRRTRGMELSRMQDLAGARIVVHNLAAQDEAKDMIREFYIARGCACREVDRRKDPRFGYKAVHLIVRIDELPVELQVRTELQDTWAQIVERQADRWGRGIRYGEDPENPEGVVRSGDRAFSRLEAVVVLMSLSHVVTGVEELRQSVAADQLESKKLDAIMEDLYTKADWQKLQNMIPPKIIPAQTSMASVLAHHSDELDAEGRELLVAGADVTGAQTVRMAEIAHSFLSGEISARAARLVGFEQDLRDILQLIADATDEGA